jgi:TIR domain
MPGIFISYRREDAPGHAGRLYDALSGHFGEDQVFMDLTMEPGVDFVDQINEAVGSCRLLIAVIGPRWATAQDSRGRRRLDDPADFIRIEIEAGLSQEDVRVIPALVQGATMPGAEELPASLEDLARRNALELSDARWRYDVARLVSTAERVLEAPSRQGGRPPSDPSAGDEPRELQATPSGLRRPARLAIATALLMVLVGVLVVVVAGGGDDEASAESRLMEAIPASVREAGCRRSRGEEFWMREHGAVVQDLCRLPRAVVSEEISGGDLIYGLFPSAEDAQDFVEDDFRFELRQEAKGPMPCGEEAVARLDAAYPDGNAECYANEEGVFITWSYPDSGVVAQLYLEPGTSVDAAVDARTKVL